MNRQQNIQLHQVRLPEPHEVPNMIVRGAKSFAQRHRYLTGGYMLGLLVLIFIGSGTQLTVQQRNEYNRLMKSIDLQAEYDASTQAWMAKQAYQETRGWFWSCDSLCQRNKRRYEEAQRMLKAVRSEGEARMRQAKQTAGIFSVVGVGEIKDSFWQYFHSGKEFARRQTMWDAMFMGIRSMTRGRDETWIEFSLKVLMQILINFSMGLFMALVFFVVGLWTIINNYQPSPLVAVAAFVFAACAAASFVATYLLAVYGAAAGGLYGVLKLAETSTRAQLGEQQRQQQRFQNRPHFD